MTTATSDLDAQAPDEAIGEIADADYYARRLRKPRMAIVSEERDYTLSLKEGWFAPSKPSLGPSRPARSLEPSWR